MVVLMDTRETGVPGRIQGLDGLDGLTNKALRSRIESSKVEFGVVEHEIVIVRKRLGPLYDVIDRGAILMTELALRIRELRDREKTLVRDLKAMRTVASENRVELVRAEEVLGLDGPQRLAVSRHAVAA